MAAGIPQFAVPGMGAGTKTLAKSISSFLVASCCPRETCCMSASIGSIGSAVGPGRGLDAGMARGRGSFLVIKTRDFRGFKVPVLCRRWPSIIVTAQ